MDRGGKTCLGCGGRLPEPFLDLGRTPLANSFVRPEDAGREEESFPLAVVYCPACHLVQLAETVAPGKMFTDYPYFSSYSDSFLSHSRAMADSLADRFKLGPDSRVLEIASNDGYLLQYFKKAGIPVLGVEPARNIAEVAEKRGIPTLNRFFGPEIESEIVDRFGRPDLIIGNNVLAHVPEIGKFLSAAASCLKPSGTAVFEFPYLKELMMNRQFDTIYHEHVFYFSLSAVSVLAAREGLRLFDVEPQPVHGGSVRVFLQVTGERPVSPRLEGLLADEGVSGLTGPARYSRFGEEVVALKNDLLALLGKLKRSGKRLAAYGAPAKGNTLLNYCGIGTDLIDFTVDRNPHKQGRLLPGSHIPVLPPEELSRRFPDYTLILPWNLSDEIIGQQGEYLRRGGQFIIPIPQPRISSTTRAGR